MSRNTAVWVAAGLSFSLLTASIGHAGTGYWLRRKGGLWLIGPDDRPLLDLRPTVEVTYGTATGTLRRRLKLELAEERRRDDGSWSIDARGSAGPARYALTFTGSRDKPAVAVQVQVDYERDTRVRREVLRFRSAALDRLTVVDRAYRRTEVKRSSQFVGSLTPHRLLLRAGAGGVTLAETSGVQGYWVRSRAGRRFELELELDHQANHPLVRLRGCRRNQEEPLPEAGWRNVARREAGEVRRAQLSWIVGPVYLPDVKRYPHGREAAIVLIDHADQSNAAKLEALAFGATGAVAAGRLGSGFPGFVNRGLRYSKSIFVTRVWPYAAHFEATPYRDLLDRLQAAGVEVGLHSLSGGADDPRRAQPLFSTFCAAYRGRTWVDHQPDTNCEAISNRGANPRSRWYILPLLRAHGFRYLWNGDDVRLPARTLNMLRPDRPATRTPAIYPAEQLVVGRERPFVLFGSAWLYNRRSWLLGRLAEDELDALTEEHGLLIGHVYLDTYRPGTRLQGRELLRRVSPRGAERAYELRPEVDRVFQRLGARQAAGKLWVAGIEAVAGHILAAMRVRLTPGPRAVRVSCDDCTAGVGISGLTLRLPRVVRRVEVDGRPPAGLRQDARGTQVWFDLARGQHRTLALYDARGALLSPLSNAGVTVTGR